jgi:hypothetical protein
MIIIPLVGVGTAAVLAVSSAMTGNLGGAVNSTADALIDILTALVPVELVAPKSILEGTTPVLTVPSTTEVMSAARIKVVPSNAEDTIDPISSSAIIVVGEINVPLLLTKPTDDVADPAELDTKKFTK